MVKGQETIDSNLDEWIHLYTDGSAFKGTMNAGYVARIEYADISCNDIHSPCGVFYSNSEAEALAIEAAIHKKRETRTDCGAIKGEQYCRFLRLKVSTAKC